MTVKRTVCDDILDRVESSSGPRRRKPTDRRRHQDFPDIFVRISGGIRNVSWKEDAVRFDRAQVRAEIDDGRHVVDDHVDGIDVLLSAVVEVGDGERYSVIAVVVGCEVEASPPLGITCPLSELTCQDRLKLLPLEGSGSLTTELSETSWPSFTMRSAPASTTRKLPNSLRCQHAGRAGTEHDGATVGPADERETSSTYQPSASDFVIGGKRELHLDRSADECR